MLSLSKPVLPNLFVFHSSLEVFKESMLQNSKVFKAFLKETISQYNRSSTILNSGHAVLSHIFIFVSCQTHLDCLSHSSKAQLKFNKLQVYSCDGRTENIFLWHTSQTSTWHVNNI
ncbi:hypothetical protein ILYODFUR_026478 [Ilyodon furcidens]|uniref:Uncharacterized protein n=1 Tax=Ilyodon furcidens TaxID=33524 RepID=A0ABV0TZM1_9TELE